MAQFIPFDKGVEVRGETVLSVINALEHGQDSRRKILQENGISKPESGQWYSQQAWLNGFKQISEEIGKHTLFSIGKAIPEHAQFPPIENLKDALGLIDVAYHMNHRNGEIGHYNLTEFDESNRKAVMVCNNPYPSEFDRGIITTMLRKFKPADSFRYDVALDESQESRLNGGESCT